MIHKSFIKNEKFFPWKVTFPLSHLDLAIRLGNEEGNDSLPIATFRCQMTSLYILIGY